MTGKTCLGRLSLPFNLFCFTPLSLIFFLLSLLSFLLPSSPSTFTYVTFPSNFFLLAFRWTRLQTSLRPLTSSLSHLNLCFSFLPFCLYFFCLSFLPIIQPLHTLPHLSLPPHGLPLPLSSPFLPLTYVYLLSSSLLSLLPTLCSRQEDIPAPGRLLSEATKAMSLWPFIRPRQEEERATEKAHRSFKEAREGRNRGCE